MILTSLILALPAFAACPIDGNASCSIANNSDFSNVGMSNEFDNTNSTPFSGTSLPELNKPSKITKANPGADTNVLPASRDYSSEKSFRTFRQTEADYGYNSSCQFGVCNQTGTPRSFER